ncbi:hypothetical protein [uncultured Tateyamaria sp.]|uniref:hypothetical protein n=1 Tax=uncultured Tateyamaria sp. TaxID=455651 RepID=UPI002611779D|nr:hypothetical protein [uncultured Tateyamaria sp.]
MKQLDNPFKESLMQALDEERLDDLVLMLANRLRSRQLFVSKHARAALPVNKDLCQPLCTNRLTKAEIDTFDIRDIGWHIIAVQDCRVVGAERFPYTVNDADYRDRIEDYVGSLNRYYGDESDMFGAFHLNGMFVDFQHLHEFRPECRDDA